MKITLYEAKRPYNIQTTKPLPDTIWGVIAPQNICIESDWENGKSETTYGWAFVALEPNFGNISSSFGKYSIFPAPAYPLDIVKFTGNTKEIEIGNNPDLIGR